MKPPPTLQETTQPNPPIRPAIIRYNGSGVRPRTTSKQSAEAVNDLGVPHQGKIATDDADNNPSQVEAVAAQGRQELTEVITQLWTGHSSRSGAVEFEKTELAASLSEYKSLLVKKGRKGKWAEFLREHDIPLSTADRYVANHRRISKQGSADRQAENSQVVTPAQITAMVAKTVAALKKKLKTEDYINSFLVQFNQAMSLDLPTTGRTIVN